jgi:hypothetical protein
MANVKLASRISIALVQQRNRNQLYRKKEASNITDGEDEGRFGLAGEGEVQNACSFPGSSPALPVVPRMKLKERASELEAAAGTL